MLHINNVHMLSKNNTFLVKESVHWSTFGTWVITLLWFILWSVSFINWSAPNTVPQAEGFGKAKTPILSEAFGKTKTLALSEGLDDDVQTFWKSIIIQHLSDWVTVSSTSNWVFHGFARGRGVEPSMYPSKDWLERNDSNSVFAWIHRQLNPSSPTHCDNPNRWTSNWSSKSRVCQMDASWSAGHVVVVWLTHWRCFEVCLRSTPSPYNQTHNPVKKHIGENHYQKRFSGHKENELDLIVAYVIFLA